MRVLNLITPGDCSGWGVCGSKLKEAWKDNYNVIHFGDDGLIAGGDQYDPTNFDAVIVPVVNDGWTYPPDYVGIVKRFADHRKPIVGYGFHEFDTTGRAQIAKLPEHFTALACGSTWMYHWVKQALEDVATDFPLKVVIQGVDQKLFYPGPQERPDDLKDRFIVASAGKFEFRKSQDVVIEAFKRFIRHVPEAVLTAAWDNPWPESMLSMVESPWMRMDDLYLYSIEKNVYIKGVSTRIIPAKNQAMWRAVKNVDMSPFYRAADIGVFPNRCEAGTNLCLMEALSCGLPCSGTFFSGHEDIVEILERIPEKGEYSPSYPWSHGGKIVDHKWGRWLEPCVEEVLSDMMYLYRNKRLFTDQVKSTLSQNIGELTWERTAKGLLDLTESVVK